MRIAVRSSRTVQVCNMSLSLHIRPWPFFHLKSNHVRMDAPQDCNLDPLLGKKTRDDVAETLISSGAGDGSLHMKGTGDAGMLLLHASALSRAPPLGASFQATKDGEPQGSSTQRLH